MGLNCAQTVKKKSKVLNLRCSAATSPNKKIKRSRKKRTIFPVLRAGKMSFPHPAKPNLSQQTLDFKRIF